MKHHKDAEDAPGLYSGPRDMLIWLVFAVSATAEPYRLYFNRPGSRGRSANGIDTAVGCLLLFPAITLHFMPPADEAGGRIFALAWQGMIVMAVLHRLASMLRRRFVHLHDIGEFWLGGPILEFVAAGAAALALWPSCPGVAAFLAAGYLANRIQIALIGLRYAHQARIAAGQRQEAEMFQRHAREQGGL